ncbi:MAG TPA: hypothetical protein VGN20_25640 [Mucilaginibacter sp.]|jgi:hypothetical protein
MKKTFRRNQIITPIIGSDRKIGEIVFPTISEITLKIGEIQKIK